MTLPIDVTITDPLMCAFGSVKYALELEIKKAMSTNNNILLERLISREKQVKHAYKAFFEIK